MKYNINNKIILLAAVSSLTFSGCVHKNATHQSILTTQDSWKTSYVEPNSSKLWKDIPSSTTVNKKTDIALSGWNKNIRTTTKKEEECVNCYATNISAKRGEKELRQSNVDSSTTFTYAFTPKDFNSHYASQEESATESINMYAQNSFRQSVQSVRENPFREEEQLSYVEQPINTLHYGAYDYVASTEESMAKEYQTLKVTPSRNNRYSANNSYGIYGGTTIQVGAFRSYANARKVARKYNLLSSNYKVEIKTGSKDNAPIHRVRISGFNNRSAAKEFMSRYGISDAFLVRR